MPYKGRWSTLPEGKRAANRSHAKIRAVGNAALNTWCLLRRLRCATTHITTIVKAILTLHLATSY